MIHNKYEIYILWSRVKVRCGDCCNSSFFLGHLLKKLKIFKLCKFGSFSLLAFNCCDWLSKLIINSRHHSSNIWNVWNNFAHWSSRPRFCIWNPVSNILLKRIQAFVAIKVTPTSKRFVVLLSLRGFCLLIQLRVSQSIWRRFN